MLITDAPPYGGVRALCMISVKSGQVDAVTAVLRKKRRVSKDIMVVAGRADICMILSGSIDEINKTVIDLKKIREIEATETLIEVEVNLGW